jgi:hypothetical protein
MKLGKMRWAALLLASLTTTPVLGATMLQCVPYARIVSGVQIYGDALTWWDQAENHYRRGHMPRKGAVLAFRPVGPMVLGHVAVVSKVLGERRVLIRHANWSVPGAIEEDVLALDVSEEGDWSEVRVWHSPTNRMGARSNPTFGFIYPDKPQLREFRPDPALGGSTRFASLNVARDDPEEDAVPPRRNAGGQPRLTVDLRAIRYADATPSARSLRDIIADVKRDAALR